ncbi:MAG: DUF1684 domain-containing protein [Acidobacteria bacterium]|nr:DUF1684 domain-containing protein [Acidobacteriota bacterium]
MVDSVPAAVVGDGMEYRTPSVVGVCMDTADLLSFRKEKDEFFKHGEQSPLPHDARHTFEGLAYYPPNAELVFDVTLDPTEPTEVQISTTDGAERTYMRVATATVTVDGTDTTMALYSSGHESLFLPFHDTTSGKETYGAGRYIDVHPNGDGTAVIDFNYAYAPFCAYNDLYSCALPPAENWLDVAIRAGEQTAQ